MNIPPVAFAGLESWGDPPQKQLAAFLGISYQEIFHTRESKKASIVFVKETDDSILDFVKNFSDIQVRIFWAQEALYPDLNIFDFALGFDSTNISGDRYIYVHPCHFFSRYLSYGNLFKRKALTSLDYKTRFCDYIYSNPSAHPARASFFQELSKHRFVSSPGRHLNNCKSDIQRLSWDSDWREAKIKYQAQSMFSIAFENAIFDGYTSEKILTSFLAQSIPIYWGNPIASNIFNKNAFIDCSRFSSFADAAISICEIEQDKDKCLCILNEPVMTDEQLNLYTQAKDNAINKVLDVLQHPQRCRPAGTWPDKYEIEWQNMQLDRLSNKSGRSRVFSFAIHKVHSKLRSITRIIRKLQDHSVG